MPDQTSIHTPHLPRLVAWEITRRCNLSCVHCRASSERGPYPGEMDTAQGITLLDQMAALARPIVILTGGEPLLREDVYLLAEHGTRLGLRMVLATNGTRLTAERVTRLRAAGIQRVSISLDGAVAAEHDAFRQVPGAFDGALEGIRLLKAGGLEFQINTTVTRRNVYQLGALLRLAVELGSAAHHLFLLVPTGRARELAAEAVDAATYEEILKWFYRMRTRVPMHLKATCAPHFYRVLRQEAHARGEKVTFDTYGLDAVTRGCLGGTAFCFVGHDGGVQPCGYLELDCGNVTRQPFDVIWREAPVFQQLRNPEAYQGKCGRCEYLRVCGGCRARAFEATGNFMAEEPLCAYQPARV